MKHNRDMDKRGQVNICDSSKNFEYDEEIDSLHIYGPLVQEESIYGAIVFGKLVFDIGASGNLLGVEIDNASLFLKLNPSILSRIKSAKISMTLQGKIILLGFFMGASR